jgi:copper(I)-binding protein
MLLRNNFYLERKRSPMYQRTHLLGVLLGLLILAACGASPAKLSVSDPWARAAAMTGASASGEAPVGQSGTMTDTTSMSGTTEMADAAAATSGGTSAAYLTISNSGSTADALIKVASDVADSVELYTMTMKGNVMTMSPVKKIDIPANGKAELKPGGFHVMLIGLRHELKEGDVVKLTLTFQNAGTVEVEAPVRKP